VVADEGDEERQRFCVIGARDLFAAGGGVREPEIRGLGAKPEHGGRSSGHLLPPRVGHGQRTARKLRRVDANSEVR